MTPLLLLLPGMLNDARVWAPVAAALADTAHRDAVEIRVAEMTLDAALADIAARAWAQLADVAPERRLVIAGFSMGGYAALEMLVAPRRRVDGLALVDTSARPETPEGRALREKTITAIERDFAKFVDGLSTFATHPAYQADAAGMDALRAMMLAVGGATAVRQNRAIMARRDQRPLLAALAMPTVVMVGQEDRITPPELADELAGSIPGARLQRLAGCGHMAPLERPQPVAEALRSLLH